MQPPKHLLDVFDLYIKHLHETYDQKRAETLTREIWSSLSNAVLLGLGYDQLPSGTKQTIVERQGAKAFMKTQPVTALVNVRVALQEGLKQVKRSQKTQDVYQCSLEKILTWGMQQAWWPNVPVLGYTSNSRALCCPDVQQGHGSKKKKKLTHRSGKPSLYALQPREISEKLQAELDTLYSFLTEPEHSERKTERVQESCAKDTYIGTILLILGWFYRYEAVPREDLSLDLLIPKLPREKWKYLSKVEQNKFWRPYKQQVEAWLTKYFQFLREEMESVSPNTKRGKLSAISALGRFQYCTAVDFVSDYEDIPVLQVITNQTKKISPEVNKRRNNREYVSNQAMKWLDIVEGQTTLTTIQKQVLEPLRIACRPKSKFNKLRTGTAIASSEQEFFAWFLLAGIPTRRQKELRETKIALSCPIQRPLEVPVDGLYQPLPPNGVRDQRTDGTVQDNYLYKTYTHQGKRYKEALWILDINDSKEWSKYGPQSIKIKNRRFEDGSYLYDYIEHYLFGWWLPGGRKNPQLYDWWHPDLRGRRGRWVGLGRASFEPSDSCYIDNKIQPSLWAWGYFFVRTSSGLPYNVSSFEEMVAIAAHRHTGKCISPHMMRSVWATWAYQVKVFRGGKYEIGLTDQEKESLAYAMGHELKTLKQLYQRCSPEEKRRPIEEAIDKMLFNELALESPIPQDSPQSELELKLRNLTPLQRQQLGQLMAQKGRKVQD